MLDFTRPVLFQAGGRESEMAIDPRKLPSTGKGQRSAWLVLGVVLVLALVAGIYALSRCERAPVAGSFYSYQLQMEHGLSLGFPFKDEATFTGYLEERGYSLLRRLAENNYEFESPGRNYLLRVKTHRGYVSAIYHYLYPTAGRPESRSCYLGCSREELEERLGTPSEIETEPVSACRYELADAVLTLAFGHDGWVVETVLQRPVVRDNPSVSQ